MALIDVSTKKYPNMFAVVDDEDYEWLSQWHWGISDNGDGKVHVRRKEGSGRYSKKIYLHRQIMGFPEGLVIDHIDGNPLNNIRSNLRACTNSQNMMNSGKPSGARSKYKGISLIKNRWRAQIRVDGKKKYLGQSAHEEEAARIYDAGAKKHFGEFARVNFP